MEDIELLQDIALKIVLALKESQSGPDILESAFPKQKAFILDKSLRKTLFCTRRSAKSFTAGLYLVYEALRNPGCNCLFIGLTRESARDIIWKDILTVINRRYDLGAMPNQAALTMTFPNGSVIKVTGVNADNDEMNKLLGRKYRLVCIDEASMYTISLDALINLIEPGLVDPNIYNEPGVLCLMGTASNFPRGLFYDITTGKAQNWKLFEWSAHDNPHVAKQWQQALDTIEKDRPLYMQTPQYKQWYLNQWVIDADKLCYKFDVEKNLIKSIPSLPINRPNDGWSFVLGVDTGWEDASAFVLTAYHINDPNLYILHTYLKTKMTFDDVVQKIQEYMAHPDFAPQRVIIDGANKQGVESMRLRSAIPFEYADKKDKATFIELMNSDLVQAKIKCLDIVDNRTLWNEWQSLIWMTDGDRIKIPKKENPSLSNHAADAALYAWRCGYHYSARPAEKKVVIGSRDWYLQQNENIWEREKELMMKGHEETDWPEMGSLGDMF